MLSYPQLPEKDDTLSMWAPDVHAMPASKAFAQLALMSGVIATFAGLVFLTYPKMPAVSLHSCAARNNVVLPV